MLHLVGKGKSYSPETVAVMMDAFDLVCQSLEPITQLDDRVREKLAIIILRVDRGDRDAKHLADTALQELRNLTWPTSRAG